MKLIIKWFVLLTSVVVILSEVLFKVVAHSDVGFLLLLAGCVIWIPIGVVAIISWTFWLTVTVLPELIFVQGYWSFLIIMIFCFAVSFLLNWKLPKTSRPLARLWPVICFMTGMAYKDALYVHLESSDYIWWGSYLADAFAICMFPALFGLLAGRLIKYVCERLQKG